MKRKIVAALILTLSVCSVFTGCGKEEKKEQVKKESVKKNPSKNTEQEQKKETEYPIIGVRTESSFEVLLKNNTGADITGIAVKTSDKTEYPANMIPGGTVLKNGETARFFYTPENGGQTAENVSTDKAVNIMTNVQFTLADGRALELSALGFEDIKDRVEICYEDDVCFAKYVSKASESEVQTKEQELAVKAQREIQQQAMQQAQEAASQVQQESSPQQAEQTQEVYQEAPAPAEEIPSPAEEAPAPAEEAPAPVEEAPAQSEDNCLGGVAIN